jgi:hypothetical protein
MTTDLTAPPDDLSLTVPEEATEYADRYGEESLVDEDGDPLVDEDGTPLFAPSVTTENVYVLRAGADDLSLIVPAESLDLFVPPDDLSLVAPEET